MDTKIGMKHLSNHCLKNDANINIFIVRDKTNGNLEKYILTLNSTKYRLRTIYIEEYILYQIKDKNILKTLGKIIRALKSQKKINKYNYTGTLKNLLEIVKNSITSDGELICLIPEKQISNKVDSCTNKTYEVDLNGLRNNKFDVDNITIDIINQIILKYQNENTRKKYLCAIQYLHRSKDTDNNIKIYLTDEITKISKKAINEPKNITTAHLISWYTILKIRDNLYNYCSNNPQFIEYYIILGLYTYIPPRRSKDIIKLYYKPIFSDNELGNINNILWIDHNKIKDFKTIRPTIGDIKNYFGKNKDNYFLQFHNYKTSDSYGIQTIEIDKIFGEQLVNFITNSKNNKEKLNGNIPILDIKSNGLQNKISKIFEDYVKIKYNIHDLRHTFITHYYSNCFIQSNLKDRDIIATKLGHSIALNEKYICVDKSNKMKEILDINDGLIFMRKGKIEGGPININKNKLTEEEKIKRHKEAYNKCIMKKKLKNQILLDNDKIE